MSREWMRPLQGLMAIFLLALAVVGPAAEVTETVLPNGLKVLIKEVHAAPVVTVDMWYKVGSRNERPGITGASHLLEHMTYKGTKEFAKEEMRNLSKRNGAVDNGATYYDYTHYYTTIASDRVELPLRMEASRLSSALIRQDDLNSERTVVRSELEGRENEPGSLLFRSMMAAAYEAHPYQWPVVGWRADIERTTAEELRAYYRTYYVPNNATLVIVGAVDTARTLELVKKYYGRIKAGAAPPQWVTPELAQRGERRVTVRRQGRVPFENIAYHVPEITHADMPALMLLEQILGAGRMSRLNQAIVESKLGVSAWASSLILREPGLFLVGGVAAPGLSLAPIEKTLFSEIEKIKANPPSAEEMARARRQLDASLIFSRDSVTQQAEQLGYYATVASDWRFLDRLPERLRAVTPAEVSRVAKTYLTADNRTVGIFEPTAEATPQALAPIAGPAGYRDAAANAPGAPSAPLARAARVITPAMAAAAAVKRERFTLPNGLVLIVQENHANPSVALHAVLRAGRAYDPQGKIGTADLVANLLDRGTRTRTSNQIAEELEGAGAELSAGTGWESVGINGKALSGDTELLVRNMADILRNADFPTKEVEKMREQMLAGIAYTRDKPSENARRTFYRTVLPAGHPYRLASFEEEDAGLQAVTRDDLAAFYRARYTPDTLIISLVGDVKTADVRALVERYFGDWQAKRAGDLQFTATPEPKAATTVTPIKDKSEVSVYVGHAGELTRTAPDYYAAQIMNMILGGGGALNSRLGDVIRDQHGLVYTVFSTFHASSGAGPWYAALGANPANVDKAVELLKAEIARLRDQGATETEVRDAVAYLTGAQAIALETNAAVAAELVDAEYFGLGLDYPERERDLYRAVTRAQVNAAAQKYLHPDHLVIAIAGPYEKK